MRTLRVLQGDKSGSKIGPNSEVGFVFTLLISYIIPNRKLKMPKRDPVKKRISDQKYYYKNQDKIREYRILTREKRKENYRKWKERNKDKRKEYVLKWKEENKEHVKNYGINYHTNRRKTDPLFRLRHRINGLVTGCFRRKGYSKTSKTMTILGIDYQTFKEHIEGQWEPWMTWDNYGKYKRDTFNYGWDIDHIIPTCTAKTEEDVYKLNHYTNLKPLCSKVNRDIKKDKLES